MQLWIMSNQVTKLMEYLLYTDLYTRYRGEKGSQGRKLWSLSFVSFQLIWGIQKIPSKRKLAYDCSLKLIFMEYFLYAKW